ncbi:MAG TPA: M23 family metallopeptidase [Blastocatellia bacterium]|nr:M23 family metallopeptidase [Blastocatellia bacterium]
MARWLAAMILIIASLVLLWVLLFTGPRNLSVYPTAAESPYRLPWPAGVSHWCGQGNRGVVTHRGKGEFCYDFGMSVGSDVCAARAGVVCKVVTEHDGNGFDAPSNEIVVDHQDGTFAWYVHLKKGGAYVTVGQYIRQGQRIGSSGNVGPSLIPHLHFNVTDGNEDHTIPVTFADVLSDSGIPRMLTRYTSGNICLDAP